MGKKQSLQESSAAASHSRRQEAFARIEIIKGPHKGSSYKLVGAKISIGRSKKNDLVLDKDEKCSRQQAVINFNKSHYTIKDVSNRTSLKINDKPQLESILQDGDTVEFGDTILRFSFKTISSHNKSHLEATNIPANITPPALLNRKTTTPVHSHKHPSPVGLDKKYLSVQHPSANDIPYSPPRSVKKRKRRRKQPKKNIGPKIVMLLIGSAALYLFINKDTSPQQEDSDKLKTLQDIEEDIKTLDELKEQAKVEHDETKTYHFKNAQFAYIRGIRDFRKGVYTRAIEAFKTCRTIDPQHDLCASYLQKSEIKQQQLIQAWMITGKAYREKHRFTACMSAFRNVMTVISNTRNLTYKEAEKNYEICLLHHNKGRH